MTSTKTHAEISSLKNLMNLASQTARLGTLFVNCSTLRLLVMSILLHSSLAAITLRGQGGSGAYLMDATAMIFEQIVHLKQDTVFSYAASDPVGALLEPGRDQGGGPRVPGPGLNVGATTYSVLSAGAVGDGVTDDTNAFLSAWASACKVQNAIVKVPSGHDYLVSPTTFSGPCQSNLLVQVDGVILAPEAVSAWDDVNVAYWLLFTKLQDFTIQGSGTFNGRGQNWWTCKNDGECSQAPTALTISHSANVAVKQVTFLNSQQIHLQFSVCTTALANSVTIQAPADSPNTDGIHVSGSTAVTIQSCSITTGDDCVSVVSSAHNIAVEDTYCGPGCHGLSVGSLGEDGSNSNVSQVLFQNSVLDGTTNGARIKTWQGGSGIAQNIVYRNIHMINVSNPIVINQNYCDARSSAPCEASSAAVHIDQVQYRNITGTSSTSIAVNFGCSESVACTNILEENINLQRTSGAAATSTCANAYGSTSGTVNPSSCLIANTLTNSSPINTQRTSS